MKQALPTMRMRIARFMCLTSHGAERKAAMGERLHQGLVRPGFVYFMECRPNILPSVSVARAIKP